MSPIDPSQSSDPFKIANAYGVKPIRVRPVPADPRSQGVDTAGLNPGQTSPPPSGITRGADQLLAGSVNTRVDFMEVPPTGAKAAGSAFAFYRHPADTNAAATSIDLGRRLDVEG